MKQDRWRKRLGEGLLSASVAFCAGVALSTTRPVDWLAALTYTSGFLVHPVASDQQLTALSQSVPTAAEPDAQPQPSPEPEPQPVQGQAVETPTPTETPVPDSQTETIPEGAGQILEIQYPSPTGERYITHGAGTIKNNTSLSAQQVKESAEAGLPFTVEVDSDQPQVLIMHTHTTETFELERKSWYDPSFNARSTDQSRNMAAVGQAMADALNQAGIHTLHDTTLHDHPSYNGSYERSHETVRKYLEQYPSIKIVIDVHRDAIEPQSGQRVSAIAEVEGRTAAQIMLICGADKGGNLPNFEKNLGFAAAWQDAMESRYPSLTRPVLLDYRYYNQDLTTGSLLIEVGSHGNTLEQAVYSGQLAGQALAELLRQQAGA